VERWRDAVFEDWLVLEEMIAVGAFDAGKGKGGKGVKGKGKGKGKGGKGASSMGGRGGGVVAQPAFMLDALKGREKADRSELVS